MTTEAQPSSDQPRFEPRPRRYGLIFRGYTWQVWDNQINDWSPHAACGGALVAAQAAADGMNRQKSGFQVRKGIIAMQEQTALRRWWNGLRPYQREVTWTGVFGLSGLALFAIGLLLVTLLWPGALETGDGLGVAIVAGSVVGLVAGLGGMLLGYRIEDRHRLNYGTTPERIGKAQQQREAFEQASREEIAGRQAAIDACELCDELGWLHVPADAPTTRCNHNLETGGW